MVELERSLQDLRRAREALRLSARDLRWALTPPPVAAAPAPLVRDSIESPSISGRIARLAADFDPAHHEPAGTVDIVTAPDGHRHWGPIDNPSARAKAEGQTLVIDQHECIHCGTCVENTAAVFVLPDDSKAVAYRQEGPMDLVQDAIDACPVTCIHWTDDPLRFAQLNDADGNPL